MIPRLGINIDHVATLRQARGEDYPSVVDAAVLSLQSGADQITIHLREDRRHIQDYDVEAVKLVTKRFGRPLNFEMGIADEIIDIAIASNPEWICLVPEKREEKTTEGGLDLFDSNYYKRLEAAVYKLKSHLPDVKISLFLESNLEALSIAKNLPIEAVEIHTGNYAKAVLNGEEFSKYIEEFKNAKVYLERFNIHCHAGHGLTDKSLLPLLEANLFEEYNIGHWVICEAVFKGLKVVVNNLKAMCEEHPLV